MRPRSPLEHQQRCKHAAAEPPRPPARMQACGRGAPWDTSKDTSMRPRSPLEHQQGCKHAAAESPRTLRAAPANNIQCAWSTPARAHACAFNIIKLQACNPGVPYAVIEFHKDSVDSDRSPPSNYKNSTNHFLSRGVRTLESFPWRLPRRRPLVLTARAFPPGMHTHA